MLDDALHLLQQRVQPARNAVLVQVGGHVQRRRIAHQQGPAAAGGQKRRIGLPAALVQPGVDHAGEQAIDQKATIGGPVVADLRRHLVIDPQRGEVLLGIGRHVHPQVRVRGNGILRPVSGRFGPVGARIVGRSLRRRREVLADQGFHLVRVQVAHRDDGHQVGPVPALVEGAQVVGRRGLDDLQQAERQPHRVLGVAEQDRELLVADALVGAPAEPPLLQHHAAFEIDLVRIQGDGVRPLAEDVHALRDHLGVGGELQLVHGLIEAGVGVDVGPESGADRLQVRDDLRAGEGGGAVEGHVLQVVGKSALGLLFQHGAGLDPQPELDALGRFRVDLDVVGQPVAQRAAAHLRVERDLVLRVLRPRGRQQRNQGRDGSDDGHHPMAARAKAEQSGLHRGRKVPLPMRIVEDRA